jgi:hypothetical protein
LLFLSASDRNVRQPKSTPEPMNSPIQYCVTVDTEEEWDWSSGYPTGSNSVVNIQRLKDFQAMCERVGTAVVYFTNHAVLANADSKRVIEELATRPRTEIGLHIHPWNTPPLAQTEKVSQRESYLHNLPWDEQRAKLDTTLAAFRAAGLNPTSFRGGRYSSSPKIQNYLRDHGVWVDCSILPFNTWMDDGAPDYRHRDLAPQRIPPRTASDRPVWELPLSYGYTRTPFRFWQKILHLANTGPGRLLRTTAILERLGIVSKSWLNFENPLGEQMLRFLTVLRAVRPPFVSFTLHSSSLMPGGSPYCRSDSDVKRLMKTAETVLKTVADWPEFAPATVTEIAQHLEAAHR